MEEVKTLSYTDKPAYQKLRSILEAGLKSIGAKDDDKLEFSSVNGVGPSSSAEVGSHTAQHIKKDTCCCAVVVASAFKTWHAPDLFEARPFKRSPFQPPLMCLPVKSHLKCKNA